MKKAFTVIELLTVMMIMGLLGTAALGGYRAMQRGMEERGVIQNVNTLVRAAYQRAQIDRQPTAVFFWNETIRGRSAEENEIVVGHAVAIRRHGRLSNVKNSLLVDEFGDLNLSYPTESDEESEGTERDQIYLYPMDDLKELASNNTLKRSLVRGKVYSAEETVMFLSGKSADVGANEAETANKLPAWAFYMEENGGVTWKPGMAYGFEFVNLTLPNGYVFGSGSSVYSTSIESPVRMAGTLVFKPGVNSGNGRNSNGTVGRSTIVVSSLRPKGAQLECVKVGETDSPEEKQ